MFYIKKRDRVPCSCLVKAPSTLAGPGKIEVEREFRWLFQLVRAWKLKLSFYLFLYFKKNYFFFYFLF
jgi:hypothetical protein